MTLWSHLITQLDTREFQYPHVQDFLDDQHPGHDYKGYVQGPLRSRLTKIQPPPKSSRLHGNIAATEDLASATDLGQPEPPFSLQLPSAASVWTRSYSTLKVSSYTANMKLYYSSSRVSCRYGSCWCFILHVVPILSGHD
jgi:hypothetical protein